MVTIDDRLDARAYPSTKLSVSRTFGDTFRVIGRGWLQFYGLSLVVLLFSLPVALYFANKVPGLNKAALDPGADLGLPTTTGPSFWITFAVFYVLQIVASLFVFGATVDGAFQMLQSGRTAFGPALRTGLVRLLPMLVAAVVFYVAFMCGLVLFVAPGLIFGAAYGLAPTLCVVERSGPFASFSRSADLTRGNRWRCLGATLLVLVLPIIVVAIVNQVIAIFVGSRYGVLIASLTNVVILPILYVFPAVLAYDLKRLRDGGAPSAVASVF